MNKANILTPHDSANNYFSPLGLEVWGHHVIGLVLFVLYGIAVCPFLDEMNRLNLVVEVSFVYALILLAQSHFATRERSVRWVFIRSMMAFTLGGILLGIGNTFFYGYPVASGFKILIGMLLLGSFISADMALKAQYEESAQRVKQNQERLAEKAHSVVHIVTVFLLMVVKDLDWLAMIGESVKLEDALLSVLLETSFLFLVSLGYAARIIYSYSKNLRLSFDNQIAILNKVSQGSRHSRVPVIRNDELGTIARHTNQMIQTLGEKELEVLQTRDVAILGLASLAEARDNETGAHILRTQHYVKTLAEYLATQPTYQGQLEPDTIESLFKSAPLHDVGKVGIPDRILLKPDKLTDEEFTLMKKHTIIGANALRKAESDLDQHVSTPFLQFAVEIAESHHEKWDGSGYPRGLVGEGIPLSARLMALADVYDALISERVYKSAFSHEKAKGIILRGKGSHFDPSIVDAFMACEQQFVAIAKNFSDRAVDTGEGDVATMLKA